MPELFEYIKLNPTTDVVIIQIETGWVSWLLWENNVDWTYKDMLGWALGEPCYPTRMEAIFSAFERGVSVDDYEIDEYYDEDLY